VKELQRQTEESQLQAKRQELHIQLLESQQVQQQSQLQQKENRIFKLQCEQALLLFDNQQLKSRIQEKDSRILELEGANYVLDSTHSTRKRRPTCVTTTHDSQN
jgi:hypothetical protein